MVQKTKISQILSSISSNVHPMANTPPKKVWGSNSSGMGLHMPRPYFSGAYTGKMFKIAVFNL